jgi:acetylornithine/succinyldiaminopimelate/putrescine aminotransferase
VYFVNSGSEAVEGAIKLSRRYTNRKKIIACRNAYHGSTLGSLSLISNKEYTSKFLSESDEIEFIDFNNLSQINNINPETACVILETVQGEAGYIPALPEFLKAIRTKCSETGTVLIFDEVQCGMGRTGSFFAYQQYGVIPDILVLAKALGGGMPLGAFMAKKEIMNSLSINPALGHITTFGGHPVSCAASLAAIQIIDEEELIEKIPVKEKLFRELLIHSEIKNITGKGLMLAVHLGSSEKVKKCISFSLLNGLITDWFLFCDSALRISPPLTITEDEIKTSCHIILKAINQC